MQNLIENPIRREMNIIKALVLTEKTMNDTDVANLNNTSIATARNDIMCVVEDYSDVFNIKKTGYTLEFTKKSPAILQMVLQDLLKHSTNIQSLTLFFFNPFENRLFYCESLGISEASFYRTVTEINNVLQMYDFKIVHKNHGYFIEAKEELQLRRFMVSIISESMPPEEIFIDLPFMTLYTILYTMTLEHLPFKFELQFSYYTYFTYISLFRETQGFNLNDDTTDIVYKEMDQLKPFFPELEHNHLLRIRQSLYYQLIPWSNEQEKYDIIESIDVMIKEVFDLNKINYDLDTYNRLMFSSIVIYASFNTYPNVYTLVFDRIEIFTDQLKRRRPRYYYRFVETVYNTKNILELDLDPLVDQLLFWFHLISPDLYQIEKTVTTKIYSDIGHDHKLFYESVIQKMFENIVILENDVEDDPDFIISNFHIDNPLIPSIIIRDYPLKEDLLNIYNFIQKSVTSGCIE
ncbi:helix-turn-helix domain-containing protein [Erysipelothrix urinaevulpis]|uniref:helix-turn-helix domain-containing protein n=1 Tax=Erysipelothrix urinaevulpis TaxID=2683717 RepID=UPI00135CAE12|nr:helix-turn-helix domain-containing protein [Erysipelothrix urinaevulpis]